MKSQSILPALPTVGSIVLVTLSDNDLVSMVNGLESRNAQLFVELTEKASALESAQRTLSKVRAADVAWTAVFNELREAAEKSLPV